MININRNLWHILIKGLVQSVGFRPFIKNLADSYNLNGYVLNNGISGVEIVLQASKYELDKFINDLHIKSPPLVDIVNIYVQPSESIELTQNLFEIRKSSDIKGMQEDIIALPPDLAICEACQGDLYNQGSRYEYSFTSCTNCGPRYSTITRLPYDRENTTFKDFPLCDSCYVEYTTSNNRRFHAQTTACNLCGPKYELFKIKSNKLIRIDFDWHLITESLSDGKIIAIKGQGGTHFVCDAKNKKSVDKLRKCRRNGSKKPFAVMMPSLDIVSKYCDLTSTEIDLISSSHRPIVILETKNLINWEHISPNLHNLGVMLPSSGFHHILFSQPHTPEVLLYTSANLPNLPMPINNEEIIGSTVDISDFVLIHNRQIHQRIDDSVIRSHGDRYFLIRRSRGFVPSPFYFDELKSISSTIAFGGAESNTASISKGGWIVPTQHIGNLTNNETLQFQRNSINHLLDLYNVKPEYLVTDLHPEFLSRININNYSSSQTQLFEIQHHVAHVSSLALDNKLGFDESVLAWASDGYGYGTDGNAWGNELILLDQNEWRRLGSMRPISYFGGDINAKYPARLALNYLKELKIDPMIIFKDKNHLFKHGKKELLALAQERKNTLLTTSLGRFLDVISIILGLVDKRTYRGEPAIVLEQYGLKGSKIENTKSFITRDQDLYQVDNLELFNSVLNWLKEGRRVKDIAWMVHQNVAISLVEIGRIIAENEGIHHLGWSGGVGYNKLITDRFEKECIENKLKFLHHKKIPPGDAGLSLGQIYYTGRMTNE